MAQRVFDLVACLALQEVVETLAATTHLLPGLALFVFVVGVPVQTVFMDLDLRLHG